MSAEERVDEQCYALNEAAGVCRILNCRKCQRLQGRKCTFYQTNLDRAISLAKSSNRHRELPDETRDYIREKYGEEALW